MFPRGGTARGSAHPPLSAAKLSFPPPHRLSPMRIGTMVPFRRLPRDFRGGALLFHQGRRGVRRAAVYFGVAMAEARERLACHLAGTLK